MQVQGAGFRVQGAGCRVQGAGCRVQGAGWDLLGGGVHLFEALDQAVFSIQEQLLRRNVKRFRGGLVFKAHRLVYHSRVIKKKKDLLGGRVHLLQAVDQAVLELVDALLLRVQHELVHLCVSGSGFRVDC